MNDSALYAATYLPINEPMSNSTVSALWVGTNFHGDLDFLKTTLIKKPGFPPGSWNSSCTFKGCVCILSSAGGNVINIPYLYKNIQHYSEIKSGSVSEAS